jgi:hypothetical protein
MGTPSDGQKTQSCKEEGCEEDRQEEGPKEESQEIVLPPKKTN